MNETKLENLPIVAFLQNMWVLPRQVATVSRWGALSEERERMIAYALFAGCVTGRRLKQVLGEELCEHITWQEASPVIAANPKDYHAPDTIHIRAVLDKHKPKVVLCFTKAGEPVIRGIVGDEAMFIGCPHPACRQVSSTLDALRRVKENIYQLVSSTNDTIPVSTT